MIPSLKDKTQLYHHLATAYNAGLSIEHSLRPELLPVAYHQHTESFRKDIDKGSSLASTLVRAKVISSWEKQILEIGERSGKLGVILHDLELFYENKVRQLGDINAKLIYPFLVFLVAILASPLPQVASGSLSSTVYLVKALIQLFTVLALYKFIIIKPFETSKIGLFNSTLVKTLKYVSDHHDLRVVFEISYLNLLTLCLESGLDVLETLKLLRENSSNKTFKHRQLLAISAIQKGGKSLSEALCNNEIIINPEISSFLVTSEQSGTLHNELRRYVLRKQIDTNKIIDKYFKRISYACYFAVVTLVIFKLLG